MAGLDSEVRELLDRWGAKAARPVGELTAEAVREDELAVLDLQRAPGELYSVEDVEAPGPAGTVPVRVYRPRPGRLSPVLFLHGGGLVIGSEGYDAPLWELALASGCLIVSPERRLAPEHPFPAAADDALGAARWLSAEAAALGAWPMPAAVAGDSSGGNLAAIVTDALTREGAAPSFQVLIYPMLDATASSASRRGRQCVRRGDRCLGPCTSTCSCICCRRSTTGRPNGWSASRSPPAGSRRRARRP